jgi:hypothetical protein
VTARLLLARIVLVGLGAAGVDAQPANATYVGLIQCDAMPARRPLKTHLTMTVSQGLARYEREIFGPTGTASGLVERGEGPVGQDAPARST